MDVQPTIGDRLEKKDEYIDKVRAAVAAAQENHIPVVYVVVGFRPGLPEVSTRNKMFSNIRETLSAAMLDPRPAIEPTSDDVVVVKRRVSAFSGSDWRCSCAP